MPDNLVPFLVPEPTVVRVLVKPNAVTGYGGATYRGVELSDGTMQIQRFSPLYGWQPNGEMDWIELDMGIASRFFACDDPTCCDEDGRTPKK